MTEISQHYRPRRSFTPIGVALGVSVGVPIAIARFCPTTWTAEARRAQKLMGFGAIAAGAILVTDSVNRVYLRQRTPLGDRAPERLVREGAYKSLRHPMSVGMTLVLLGQSVAFNRFYVALWAFFVACVSTVTAKTVERRELDAKFGNDYKRYVEETGAVFPRFRRSSRRWTR